MAKELSIVFSAAKIPAHRGLAILVGKEGVLSPFAADLDKKSGGMISAAIEVSKFGGKLSSTLEIWLPESDSVRRCLLIGIGNVSENEENEWLRVGGVIVGKLATSREREMTLIAEAPQGEEIQPQAVAEIALGMKLRSYKFDKYKTVKKDDDNDNSANGLEKITILLKNAAKAKRTFEPLEAVAKGVFLARDLVNEPANTLGPVEFAAQAKALTKLGMKVEILNEKDLLKLKMGALLGVAQGSVRPARVAIMRWEGAKSKKTPPVAFVGKGVVFDTGGISLKPGPGMGDMKGDMGGAAAVIGLMCALAARKAKVNAVGVIGLVENMPAGNAMRPGDIITAMSGQTIEVLNTDAEGRLVLADALWYTQKKFKPCMTIDLATLTGAILVALGQDHAGLFSNDDELSGRLAEAGQSTGEKVWRLPLDSKYDKMIDSKNADMKNIGGRFAGSITAAQFLQRYVDDTPWAHLDIAGTAMNSPKSDISQSWSSGFGVRLLDRLVANHYED